MPDPEDDAAPGLAGESSPLAVTRKRSLKPVVIAGVAALALAAGLVVLLGGGDMGSDGETGGDDSAEDELSPDAVAERYASLGSSVTADVSECAEDFAPTGATEQLSCTLPDGTLVLTTYESEDGLLTAREQRLDSAAGTIESHVESGAFYSFDPTAVRGGSEEPAVVYWDSLDGRQTAELTGSQGVSAEELHATFTGAGPMLEVPAEPADPGVTDLVDQFRFAGCARIPVGVEGQTEESVCRLGRRTVHVGRFATARGFGAFREEAARASRGDGPTVRDIVFEDVDGDGLDPDEPELGKIYGYVEERPRRAVLHVDVTDCRCYFRLYDDARDAGPQRLVDLVFG